MKEGAEPSYKKPYPLNPEKKSALDKILDVLLKNKCIEHSTCADWNSPVILVSKGDGRWRLVIDFRGANAAVANEAVIYPRPDDIFEMCQDALYMFLIDGSLRYLHPLRKGLRIKYAKWRGSNCFTRRSKKKSSKRRKAE